VDCWFALVLLINYWEILDAIVSLFVLSNLPFLNFQAILDGMGWDKLAWHLLAFHPLESCFLGVG